MHNESHNLYNYNEETEEKKSFPQKMNMTKEDSIQLRIKKHRKQLKFTYTTKFFPEVMHSIDKNDNPECIEENFFLVQLA